MVRPSLCFYEFCLPTCSNEEELNADLNLWAVRRGEKSDLSNNESIILIMTIDVLESGTFDYL
ncbi:hypothetical protein CJ030_MR8G004890 [Morella rubra]|uniref:Uncharacterized protein n=1 Tax=Morella rubra TaxID=262757 RepID=A0A6A1UUA0_9ROSI|nr:hypothetical protein CJ030_MR8G004890 [Morella rubra]